MSAVCLSWFNESLASIYQAIRRKAHLIHLIDGKEVCPIERRILATRIKFFFPIKISVNPNFSLISTINPTSYNQIPYEIRSMFRVISLMEPDMKQIITAKCTQYGIKCGDILGNRLKILFEVCQDSMMSFESKAQITVSNLIDILYAFYTQKKPTQLQAVTSSYGLRSNSVLLDNQNEAGRKYASSKIESNILTYFRLGPRDSFLNFIFCQSARFANHTDQGVDKKESHCSYQLLEKRPCSSCLTHHRCHIATS
jgi:hypothetical protein